MHPYQERVVTEKQELDTKISKLKAFFDPSSVFHALPTVDKVLLVDQFDVMGRYSKILGLRIARFEEVK